MADNNYPDINIGDFAEQMLTQEVEQIKEGAKPRPNLNNTIQEYSTDVQNQRDISNIEVPDDLMEAWTGKKVSPKERVKEPDQKPTPTDNLSLALSKLSESIDTFKTAVLEAQTYLQEMAVTPGTTTCGHIGVNLAGSKSYDPSKKKKKKKKKKKSTTKNEDIIRQALLDYLED